MASPWSDNGGSYPASVVYATHHPEAFTYHDESRFQSAPQYSQTYPHFTSLPPQPPFRPLPHKYVFSSPETRAEPRVVNTSNRHLGPFLKIAGHCPQQAHDEACCPMQDVYEDMMPTEDVESDEQAAQGVKASFRRRLQDSKPERILRSLIRPKSADAEYDLDDNALQSIFLAVNAIFFNGRLTNRVNWIWSHESDPGYDSQIAGHTSFRKANQGGYETLVTLSEPILKDRAYNRRLLISAFIHELIHCYLFVCCGIEARSCGGHTPAFHEIAKIIDKWAGHGMLHLCDMEADLDHFRVGDRGRANQQRSPSPAHYHNRHKAEYSLPYRYPATVVSHSGSAYWEQPCCNGRWDYPAAPVARA